MSETSILNIPKLMAQLTRFTAFVQHVDGRSGLMSFRDRNYFLGREEDYKRRIAEEARAKMKYDTWEESWIGTGDIAEYTRRAVNMCGNLIDYRVKNPFLNSLDRNRPEYLPEADRVLYDIYRSQSCSEEDAFENAVKLFGANYSVIAYLFFIKDDTRFLPISPKNFDVAFSILGIDYKTSWRCSWDNYAGFISIIKEIRGVMEDVLPLSGSPSLLDAHSFVWIIREDKYIKWNPDEEQNVQIEQATEEYIQGVISGTGGRRSVSSSAYIRSSEVVKETRKRAGGVCQLCHQPAPFIDKNGKPYLEVHHVVWLSRGGEDSTTNTVALCPNCHTRMHVLDKPEDVEKLKTAIGTSEAIV